MAKYLKDYTKKPTSAAQYSMMRGVTDFTNAAQLNMFESGHAMIVIINKPKFIDELAKRDADVKDLLDNFCNIIEYEFKNLDGLEDINADVLEYTDGISTIEGVGKVNEQSNSDITMSFTEKSGSTITKFIKYYLDGVRDSRTQIKHYHGLIAEGELTAGFENEVFNLLYIMTDSTGLSLEAAYLLANAWPSSAKVSIYEYDKSSIEARTVDVNWKCFVLRNVEIDKRAVKMLAHINEDNAVYNVANKLASSVSTQASYKDVAETAKGVTKYADNQVKWDSQKKDNYESLKEISALYGQDN